MTSSLSQTLVGLTSLCILSELKEKLLLNLFEHSRKKDNGLGFFSSINMCSTLVYISGKTGEFINELNGTAAENTFPNILAPFSKGLVQMFVVEVFLKGSYEMSVWCLVFIVFAMSAVCKS